MKQITADHLVAAFLNRPRDARLALEAGGALDREGRTEEAVAIWSLGDDVEPLVRRAKNDPNAPEDVRALSARADAAFRKHFTQLHIHAVDAFETSAGADLSRVRNAVWPLTHDGPVEYGTPKHNPMIFYMPDLPAEPIMPRERLPWAPALAAAWRDIRDEYERALGNRIAMAPHVPAEMRDKRWEKLRGALDWSSVHLFKEAKRTPYAGSFPRTVDALKAVDLVSIDGEPMDVFFSRLKPGAHIPPHYGLTNTRLTTHLPLIVPDGCSIRVGAETYHWREGELFAFDDSFEHEAWNRSSVDRVVLIFVAHHPGLSAAERAAIEHAYSVRQSWLDGRRSLLERRHSPH